MSQRKRRLSESLLQRADLENEDFTPETSAPDPDCVIIHEGRAAASTNVPSSQGNPVSSPKPSSPVHLVASINVSPPQESPISSTKPSSSVSPVATSSAPPPPKDINWATPSVPNDSGLRVGAAAMEVDDDELSVYSILTETTNRQAPSVLSMYDRTADAIRRQTLLGKENPNIHTVELFCKRCPAHGEQPTAAEGRKHLRRIHSQCICPQCFIVVPSYHNDYKDHLKKHFVKKRSKLEEIACRYCEEKCHYEDLWDHIDQVHFVLSGEDTQQRQASESNGQQSLPNLGRGFDRTTDNSRQPIISAGYHRAKTNTHLKVSGVKERQATATSASRHDLPSGVEPHVFPGTSRATATGVLERVVQPTRPIPPSCNCFNTRNVPQFNFTRRYFTADEKNKMATAFISKPNKPWDERSKRLATEFDVPLPKVQNWFYTTRGNFMKRKPPSWARNADFSYDWNVENNGELRFTLKEA